jgi:CheY-like chemotaxis protein
LAKILIVEDNSDERRILATTLYYNGFETEEAGNGIEAIRAVKIGPPDLIIMDVKLPDMNGFLATEIIRAVPGCEKTPVVCVTGMDIPLDIARERGCSDLLIKPVTPEGLVNSIRRLLPTPDQV